LVKEDDVVALIETDKVTVDIKATVAGVLTKQFGAM
jgi:pyruvate/2-oxoglutarate dehydrogenase complex dihydrolipoamide acyltransferase (E2) component